MKFLKIFSIALVAAFVTSCSDDDTPAWNTDKDVVVEMGLIEQPDGTYSNVVHTKEGEPIVKIPLEIKGKRNGDIEITVVVKGEYENTASDDVNVFITTKSVIVFPEDNVYNLEVAINDDDEMNETRWCDIAIESVKGGTIGQQNFTTIEIKDNDTEPYDRCAGQWILKTATLTDAGDLKEERKVIYLSAYPESDKERYKVMYRVQDLQYAEDLMAYFSYDKETNSGTISINYGSECGSYTGSNGTLESVTLFEGILTDSGYSINNQGATIFDYSAEFTKISEMTVEPSEITGTYPMWLFLRGSGYIAELPYYVTGMERIKTGTNK